MHIPDGFINAGTSLGAGVAAAGGLSVCVARTKEFLEEKQAPLAGLVAAFIFAAQMINFPIATGTSGHLLGGALAVVLVGPWAGAIAVAVVLVVQAFLFADGGLTALGLNILNMAIVGGLGGWVAFRATRALLPTSRPSVVAASAVAAFASVVLASVGFVVEYAVGGTGDAPIGTVLAAMVGAHTLIGIGEAVITAMTVSAVLAVRPDLVHGAAGLQAPLELRTVER